MLRPPLPADTFSVRPDGGWWGMETQSLNKIEAIGFAPVMNRRVTRRAMAIAVFKKKAFRKTMWLASPQQPSPSSPLPERSQERENSPPIVPESLPAPNYRVHFCNASGKVASARRKQVKKLSQLRSIRRPFSASSIL